MGCFSGHEKTALHIDSMRRSGNCVRYSSAVIGVVVLLAVLLAVLVSSLPQAVAMIVKAHRPSANADFQDMFFL